jgi:hypothetical protein
VTPAAVQLPPAVGVLPALLPLCALKPSEERGALAAPLLPTAAAVTVPLLLARKECGTVGLQLLLALLAKVLLVPLPVPSIVALLLLLVLLLLRWRARRLCCAAVAIQDAQSSSKHCGSSCLLLR